MRFFLFCCLFLLFIPAYNAGARVLVANYGLTTVADATTLNAGTQHLADSVILAQPMMASHFVISDIEKAHLPTSKTADFYLLLFLCLLLGIIRFLDERYFYNLWVAFWNPAMSGRQLKDQIQGAGFPNILMNIFFTIAEGAYLYYVVKYFTPHHTGVIPSSLLIIMLISGTAIIYLAKYSAVRFSGWAFRMEGVTEQYLFNVFLINKILAMVLIPFIIVLAFADPQVAQQMMVISFVVAGALLLNRYIRSWQVFGSFFQYSKFHFFMYLCASELLPLAVLMKLLVKGLMFY